MPDPSIQVRGVIPAPQRLVVDGYVSTVQPAPGSFSDSLYVIVPEMSTEVPLGPCEWMEGHGTALPAQGAKVVVVFDEREVPVIVWWEGQYAEPKPGAWLELESLNKVKAAAGFQSVRVRTEQGATVARLRGALESTAILPTATRIATVPIAARPPGEVRLAAWAGNSQIITLTLNTEGELIFRAVTGSGELSSGFGFGLDSISYNLT